MGTSREKTIAHWRVQEKMAAARLRMGDHGDRIAMTFLEILGDSQELNEALYDIGETVNRREVQDRCRVMAKLQGKPWQVVYERVFNDPEPLVWYECDTEEDARLIASDSSALSFGSLRARRAPYQPKYMKKD